MAGRQDPAGREGARALNAEPAPSRPGRHDVAALVIHDLDQARAALSAARDLGAPVLLVTAPGAAMAGGPLYLKVLLEAAAADVAGARWSALIDCGDRAGDVFAALDAGWTRLAFAGTADARARLADLADARGARLEPLPGLLLDLGSVGDPDAASRGWLMGPRVAGP